MNSSYQPPGPGKQYQTQPESTTSSHISPYPWQPNFASPQQQQPQQQPQQLHKEPHSPNYSYSPTAVYPASSSPLPLANTATAHSLSPRHVIEQKPDMAALHPQQQPIPPPQNRNSYQPIPQATQMYAMQQQLPAQEQYRRPYAPPPQPPQTAPRQRTAIACRYCRRRKIRCSGFESSEDGKCQNCQRFNQECIFTPVSSHSAQAFVPYHAVYNRGSGVSAPLQVYGAHGQPLPPQAFPQPPPGATQVPTAPVAAPTHDAYGRPVAYSMHPPHPGYPQPAPASYPAPAYDDRVNRESGPPISQYPPPGHPAQAQTYYAAPPPPVNRQSPSLPQNPYVAPHDMARNSTSPHTQSPRSSIVTPSYHYQPTPENILRPPMGLESRTPPPVTSSSQRPGLSISSLVSADNVPGVRSATDRDMLNRLSRA